MPKKTATRKTAKKTKRTPAAHAPSSGGESILGTVADVAMDVGTAVIETASEGASCAGEAACEVAGAIVEGLADIV